MIVGDVQNIVDRVNTDPNASDQLEADVTQGDNDRTTCMTTLTAELQKIAADRQHLVTGLTRAAIGVGSEQLHCPQVQPGAPQGAPG